MSVCSKFVPNFFNKNRCQACFKSKKCHIDQNSEKNQQITRTVIRCSFLFVSPEECHSLNKNLKVKKWQRRWFILYSDGINGELTYSLDQSSLTLPTSIIRLDEVEQIRLAPEIHEHAIAIVYLDKIYYIRGNSKDEIKKWLLDLCKFVKNFDNNQTNSNQELSSKHCIIVDAVTKRSHESINNNSNNLLINQHNYQQVNNNQINNGLNQLTKPKEQNYLDNNNLPNQLNNNHIVNQYENQIKARKKDNIINPVFKFLSYVNDINSVDCADCTNNQNKLNVINDKLNYQKSSDNNENNLNAQNKINNDNKIQLNHHSHHYNLPLITSDSNTIKIDYNSKLNKFNSQDDTSKLILKRENNLNKSTNYDLVDYKINRNINDIDYKTPNINQRNKSLPDLRNQKEENKELENSLKTKENKTSSIKLNNNYNFNYINNNHNNHNIKILKTGWLMRKGNNRLEWYKHWFILKDRQLTYYRDKSSLLLDGVFDLSLIKQIETDFKFLIINHNLNIIYYPFKIIMWDNKEYDLASPISNEDKNEWINLILDNQKQLNNSSNNLNHKNKDTNLIDQQISNKNLNLNLNEKDSDAESSSDSSTPICQVFTDQIPSSPPLNRNAISRMKYKLKDNIKNKEGKLKLIKHDNLINKKCLNDLITTNYTINKEEKKEEDEEAVEVEEEEEEENVNKILSNNNLSLTNSTIISSSSVNESSNITNSTTSSTDSLNNNSNHNNDNNNNSKLKNNCFQAIDSGLDASSEDNIHNYLITNKLSTKLNDNKINIDITKNNLNKLNLDFKKSNDHINSDDSDNELKRIKFSIVELQKFCLNIINELQLTNNDLTDLKRNLIQKDLLSFLLGNHILNGSVNIDTFTDQLNRLMSNLKDHQNKTKLNSSNTNCNISSNNSSSLNSILNQSSIILEHQSLDNNQPNLDKSITSPLLNLISDSLSNQPSTKLTPSTSSINLEKSINDDYIEFKDNKTDKIYLTREQFDNLLNKNSELEHRLSITLKTLQRLNTELKESYQNYDHLEICNLWMKNEFKSMLKIKRDEYSLMQEKINYLTNRLVQIEKSYKLNLDKLAELEGNKEKI